MLNKNIGLLFLTSLTLGVPMRTTGKESISN